MPATKLSIIYYSQTGTIDAMAHRLAATAEKLGAEVRLRSVGRDAAETTTSGDQPERPTADDVTWADAVLVGTTRFGNVAGRLKIFLDSLGGPWSRGELADKVYAGFTSSQTLHGGQESTLLNLYTTFHHFGGIIVSPATPTAPSSSMATPTASATSPAPATTYPSTTSRTPPSTTW